MNSLEKDIIDDAGKRLSEHIDRMVLAGAGLVFDFYLEYGEGRVYGARYLTVAPMNAEWQWPDMMQWMVETFGALDDSMGVFTPNQRWYANNAKFWFRNQKDRDWFVLRWS